MDFSFFTIHFLKTLDFMVMVVSRSMSLPCLKNNRTKKQFAMDICNLGDKISLDKCVFLFLFSRNREISLIITAIIYEAKTLFASPVCHPSMLQPLAMRLHAWRARPHNLLASNIGTDLVRILLQRRQDMPVRAVFSRVIKPKPK